MSLKLFNQVSLEINKIITQRYSTSFSLAILTLEKKYREAIFGIYGFVRIADEIVDTFIIDNKEKLLNQFIEQTYEAINEQISTNPVLNAFQIVVNKYEINKDFIAAFFNSMATDISKQQHTKESYDTYIYGSAEVVGLMCLQVFVDGNKDEFDKLIKPAKILGSAFQKINFLRDIHSDWQERHRFYFPNTNSINDFDDIKKQQIQKEVLDEFQVAFEGIKKLPKGVKLGVYLAYLYYLELTKQISKKSAKELIEKRISVSNFKKLWLMFKAYLLVKIFKSI
ncbi:MAG: phytoene/squalene synthase family protein [Candidatus Kapaibacteriota bacterium]